MISKLMLETLHCNVSTNRITAIAATITLSKFFTKTMAKADIHPKWYPEAKVYCNGEVVMTVGSTKPELHVDVWSGNHPFYTGTQKMIDTEGRVERFMRKYGLMETEPETAPEDKK